MHVDPAVENWPAEHEVHEVDVVAPVKPEADPAGQVAQAELPVTAEE